jgi:hypothetical protein
MSETKFHTHTNIQAKCTGKMEIKCPDLREEICPHFRPSNLDVSW